MAIITNIAVLLMTTFMLQGHIFESIVNRLAFHRYIPSFNQKTNKMWIIFSENKTKYQ